MEAENDHLISKEAAPRWLMNVNVDASPPIPALLEGSVFYPACGLDGRPVQYLAGNSHSFIYVDYGVAAPVLTRAIGADNSFKGYQLFGGRFLHQDELPNSFTEDAAGVQHSVDGDPNRYRKYRVAPYTCWAVFQRMTGVPETHGPERFSLLYIAADGVAAYQALYGAHQARPQVVAIIQPGHAFGHNWTNFYDPNQILARTVATTVRGGPRYLLIGGRAADMTFLQSTQWPGYDALIKFWKSSDGYLGLWERQADLTMAPLLAQRL